jgi:hypothetical protein
LPSGEPDVEPTYDERPLPPEWREDAIIDDDSLGFRGGLARSPPGQG